MYGDSSVHDRRKILMGFALVALLPPHSEAKAVSLVDLKGLGELVDAISRSMGNIAESIARVISLGDRGLSEISARNALSALKDLDSRLKFLASATQVALIRNFHDYVELGREALSADEGEKDRFDIKLKGAWTAIVSSVSEITRETTELLSKIRNDRSDFVLEEAYGILAGSLNDRIGILKKIRDADPPKSSAELNELNDVAGKYDTLRAKTLNAVDQLSAYIKSVQRNRT